MVSFFKKSVPLIKHIPKNFVDIHSHLLPNVDDGSKSFKESLLLLQKIHSFGVNNLVLTPHIMEGVWENSRTDLIERFNQLKEYLKEHNFTEINLHLGAEYMLDGNFNKLLKSEPLLTIKDNFILVEMSYLSAPVNLYETIFDIQIANYKPILAHPERYNFLHTNFNEYKKLKDAGCLFQLNLLSLTNYYGKEVKKVSIKLLKENLIDFVGSDTHHERHLNSFEKIDVKNFQDLLLPILKNNSTLSC